MKGDNCLGSGLGWQRSKQCCVSTGVCLEVIWSSCLNLPAKTPGPQISPTTVL